MCIVLNKKEGASCITTHLLDFIFRKQTKRSYKKRTTRTHSQTVLFYTRTERQALSHVHLSNPIITNEHDKRREFFFSLYEYYSLSYSL